MVYIRSETIAAVDVWLDSEVGGAYVNQPLAQDWARVAKITEEVGEAVANLISATGQNPRKGINPDHYPLLLAELADVVLTGVLAIQHFTKDPDETNAIIAASVAKLESRLPEKYRDQVG